MKTAFIDSDKLATATAVVEALAHPNRLKIIRLIDHHQSMTIQQIFHRMDMDKTTLAQHLRVLRLSEVVFAQKSGKTICYTLNYQKLSKIQS